MVSIWDTRAKRLGLARGCSQVNGQQALKMGSDITWSFSVKTVSIIMVSIWDTPAKRLGLARGCSLGQQALKTGSDITWSDTVETELTKTKTQWNKVRKNTHTHTPKTTTRKQPPPLPPQKKGWGEGWGGSNNNRRRIRNSVTETITKPTENQLAALQTGESGLWLDRTAWLTRPHDSTTDTRTLKLHHLHHIDVRFNKMLLSLRQSLSRYCGTGTAGTD